MEWNDDLEAAIREDPDDEARWAVLEDWLLERGDIRGEIVRLDKAGDREGAQTALWEMQRQLFGTRKDNDIILAIGGSDWRCGYITTCRVKAPSSRRLQIVEALLAMRSAASVRWMRFDVDEPDQMAPLCRLLEGAPCAPALRRLDIEAYWRPARRPAVFDAAWIASLPIREVRLYGRAIAVPYHPALRALHALAITPGSADELRDLLRIDGMPELRELVINIDILEHRNAVEISALESLFDGRAVPKLERLQVNHAGPDVQRLFLDELAAGKLLPRLRAFGFGYAPLERDKLPERHRAAFAHLQVQGS